MNNKHRLPQLDFLRSIAVLLVVLYHYNVYSASIPFYNRVIQHGGELGVILFFILSGYLMTSFYTQTNGQSLKTVSPKSFYLARFFRIMPLYIFTMIVFFILKDHINLYRLSKQTIDAFGLIKGFFFFNDATFKLNPVIWTLKVEVLFYVFFPLIGLAIQQSLIKKLTGLAFLVPFFLYILSYLSLRLQWNVLLLNNLGGLTTGILVRLIYFELQQRSNDIKLNSLVFFGILLPAAVLLYLFLDQSPLYTSPLLGIIVFANLILNHNSAVFKAISLKPFYYIALISYSIYLLHFNVYYNIVMPVANVHLHTGHIRGVLNPLVSILITVLFSVITYNLIEIQAPKLRKFF